MKRGADVLAFPTRVPIRCSDEDSRPRSGLDSATIIILPVVRTETYRDLAPACRPNNGGDAA